MLQTVQIDPSGPASDGYGRNPRNPRPVNNFDPRNPRPVFDFDQGDPRPVPVPTIRVTG
jgi:hypothetical protein